MDFESELDKLIEAFNWQKKDAWSVYKRISSLEKRALAFKEELAARRAKESEE